ncbi:MAG: CYTH domain-containing protein [Lachnospiraceae bacterium]|nr:CYTH domain-containing protein [Lachnospiraceae bacterium]MBP3595724.1 CYTH domain-containing protein [Lachnospiraceae bacterium]
MEIERKFTVKKLPENLEQYEKKEIEQAYLCTGPVVRIRKSNEDYILTYKSKKGVVLPEHATARSCEEVELPLTREAYEHLREKADGQVIAKTRYLIPIENGRKIELDMFHGYLEGLIFAEVEFGSEEEAAAYQMPDWFAEDVTFDRRYSNAVMTRYTSLKELQDSSPAGK